MTKKKIRINKEFAFKSLKIGLGSCIAILIAECLSLQYATTAGIVALLSIQNTKRATFNLAAKRVISFILSIILIVLLRIFINNNDLAFALFMCILSYISFKYDFADAISVNAVLGVQAILSTPVLTYGFIREEALVIFIGTTVAILFNLYIPDKSKEIEKDIVYIEEQLKDILYSLARHLLQHRVLDKDKTHISELISHIDHATDKAFDNVNITLSDHSQYYVEYLAMRKRQCVILLHFFRSIPAIDTMPAEAEKIAAFMIKLADEIHLIEKIDLLKADMEVLIDEFSNEGLPESIEDFNNKARLFSVLQELEEFLKLAEVFVKSLSEIQVNLYIRAKK